jgi:hypothetical protein
VGGTAVLGIALLLVLFLALLLSVPLEFVLHVRTGEERRTRVAVRWLFGIVRKDIYSKKRKPKKPAKERKRKYRGFPSFLRSREIILRLVRLLLELLAQVRVRQIAASLRVGLGDPADTGILYGLLCAGLSSLNFPPKAGVRVEPVFDQALFEATADGTVRVYPITLFPACLRFAFSPELWWAVGRKVFKR